ncbi:H-NS family histone-like protein [Providencia huashanensis]
MSELTKNDEYDITRKTLSNITSIRSCFKNTPIDLIDDILGKLAAIKEEKEAEYRQFEAEAVERNEKRLQAVTLLEEAGLPVPPEFLQPITAEFLATGQTTTKRSKGAAKPRKVSLAWRNPEKGGEWEKYSSGRMANWVAKAKDEYGETDETLTIYAEEYNKEMGLE